MSATLRDVTSEHLAILSQQGAKVLECGTQTRAMFGRGLVVFEFRPEGHRWSLGFFPEKDVNHQNLLLRGIPEDTIPAVIDLARNYDLDVTFPVLIKQMAGERCESCTLTEVKFPERVKDCCG